MRNTPIHIHQMRIIKKLILSKKGLQFKDIVLDDITTDHTNYHLKELVRFGFVTKKGNLYVLTDSGKDFSSNLDDKIKTLETMLKTSIIAYVIRHNEHGVLECLVNRRTRHPYFGKVGRITGKVKFGEPLQNAVLRELKEETGLTAKVVKLVKIYRKIRMSPKGEVVQDNVFYIFYIDEVEGTLKRKTAFQENFWITKDDYVNKRYDFYDDFVFDLDVGRKDEVQYEENISKTNEY